MSQLAVMSCDRTRVELVARVRARRSELEEAILARIRASTSSAIGDSDAEYAAGLRSAVAAAVDHGLMGIERGRQSFGPVPHEAIAQAHRAARVGVSVDTVLRRYVLGSTLLGDFLMQEASSEDLADQGTVLREMLSDQAGILDRLMTAITDEYMRELRRTERSPEQHRTERVQRLLSGGHCDTAELGYELECWHIGAIATGAGANELLKQLAGRLGSSLLCVPRGRDNVWAWLGSARALSGRDVERAFEVCGNHRGSLAVGEPGKGMEGWRLTHLQAQAAMRVALCRARSFTRYADVALLASVLRDDALSGSLVEIYLAPLGSPTNGGAVLRETLRAYFAAEHNASSAASALGVTRHTVQNRLRTIEEKLGQALRTRQAEIEVALRMEELGDRRGESVDGD
jgi:hypothetical protein